LNSNILFGHKSRFYPTLIWRYVMGFADLHIHTIYSWDGTCSVTAVLKQAAQQAGLNVIAITDHDEIAGTLEAVRLAPYYGIGVIPGSEVTTSEGHLLAYFIQKKIPAGRSLIETTLRVGEQGGICIAAHPTAPGSISLSELTIRKALTDPDVARVLVGIEVFNASLFHSLSNSSAHALANTLPVSQVGSSDSHVLWTIGQGATVFSGCTVNDLRHCLETRKNTMAIGKTASFSSILISWLYGYFLRKAGWVRWNSCPDAPLTLGRISQIEPEIANLRSA
jgi:predicted metal-dependent phosphoesterase TrpH